MLDLHRLAILQRFAQTGSIAATASSLGYSPSAISQQIATLETETGAHLLQRSARSAALTSAGELLARHAGELIAHVERVESELAALSQTVAGSLTVGASPSLATAVASALAGVQAEHPALEIAMRQLNTHDAADSVVARNSDIAVLDDWADPSPSPLRGLVVHDIAREPIRLTIPAAHPAARSATALSPAALRETVAGVTWLCTPPDHRSRQATDRRLAQAGAEPARRWEFEGLATIAQLVAEGAGCALLPDTVLRGVAADRIAIRSLRPVMARRLFAITRAGAGPSPALQVCVAAVSDAVRRQVATRSPRRR